jgi:hypothetical protein
VFLPDLEHKQPPEHAARNGEAKAGQMKFVDNLWPLATSIFGYLS